MESPNLTLKVAGLSTSYTSNLQLPKPSHADRGWDVALNLSLDAIDRQSSLGGLAVTPFESPSQSLAVRIASGSFVRSDNSIADFSGLPSLSIPPNSTNLLWITDSGVVMLGAQFPPTTHLRLATVQSNASSIESIVDQRIQCRVAGQVSQSLMTTGGIINGSLEINASSGSQHMFAVNTIDRTISLFGADPTAQLPALAPLQFDNALIASNQVAAIGANYSQSEINQNFSVLASKINALITAMKQTGLMLKD